MTEFKERYYVSNKALFAEYVDWYAAIDVAKEEGIEEPQVPSFIVDAMMKISSRLSYKPNFINYSFRDDMVGDALYDCIRFAKKFNPEKGSNPFSYITTICFNAFLRRIDKEKKQTYVRGRIVANSVGGDFFEGHCNQDDIEFSNQYIDFLREVGYSEDAVPMSIRRNQLKKRQLADGGQEEIPSPGPFDSFC